MKVLLPDLTAHQSLADRFLREIRLLASLNHPNIAALRTALTYENQLVMIMEFVRARLWRTASRAPDFNRRSGELFRADPFRAKLCPQTQHHPPRHQAANMMLTPQGVVKLMDFGIARSGTDGSLTPLAPRSAR